MKQNIAYQKIRTSVFFFIAVFNFNIAFGQPIANFSATPAFGCAPLVVQFFDSSQGTPTSWSWNLGNGASSSQKNPATTYLNPGIYTVKLTVSNVDGSNTITRSQFITVYGKPSVNFTVGDSTKCVPFATTFKDLSTTSIGTNIAWDWDFDDGTVSNEKNPNHQYNIQGNYNITLRVTNSGGCVNSLSKLSYIKASDSIRTNFNFTKPEQCKAPETIRFFNNTTGPGTLSFLWNFGDGSSSSVRSPSHVYVNGGAYSIQLIVSNDLGCVDTVLLKDTLVIKNNQSVINGPDSVCLDANAQFNNGTVPAPLSTSWKFDDGSTTFGLSTARQWMTPGVYPLKMISRYSNCIDSAIKLVTVMSAPAINIQADDSNSCKVPFTVNFTAVTPGGVEWVWSFGDSTISTVENPSHTYNSFGAFNVKLIAKNNAGCESIVRRYPLINTGTPIVTFDDSASIGGCIPFVYQPRPTIISPEPITGYFWDFGNGTTSTLSTASTLYNTVGNNNVSLTTTTADGCVSTTSTIVTTGTPAAIDFIALPTIQCPGTDILFRDSSISINRWRWTFGDGQFSDLQHPIHQYGDTGKYDIKLIGWNNGCPDTLTKPAYINILPGIARYRLLFNCTNKREVAFKDSSIGANSWFWDFGDGTTSALADPTHVFPGFQDYTVSLTITNDSCSNTRTSTVRTINETADFRVSKNDVCKRTPVTFFLSNLNKNNLKSYVWNFGDGSSDSSSRDSIVHVYTQPGNFAVTLTITDNHNCTDVVVKNNFIKVFSPIAAFSVNSPGGCARETFGFTNLSLAADGSDNIARWTWDFGDGSSQIYTAPLLNPLLHTYPAAGSYYPSLVIADSAGCTDSISYAMPVNIYQPTAEFFASNYNTCRVDTVLFRNPSTGTRLNYLWDFGDGTFSSDSLPIKQFSTDGIYTVKLVVTDAFGCKDSLIKNNYVTVREVLAGFTVSDSNGTCIPFQVKFTNTSQNGLINKWNFGDGGLSSTTNPVYYFTSQGEYFVTLTSSRSLNCASKFTQRIRVTAPSGTLSYSPVSGCAPLDVNFHLTTSDRVSFIWDFDDGTSFASSDSSVTHQFLLPGQFVPKVILKDSSGCVIPVSSADTIRLYSSKVNFGVSDTLVCGTAVVSFTDSTTSGSTISSYRWDFGDGTYSTDQSPVHSYLNEGIYPIKLLITTIFGCLDSLIKTAYVRVAPKPAIGIIGDSIFCGPAPVALQGIRLNTSADSYSWTWNFGNGNSSIEQIPPAQQFDSAGLYQVQLIAQNSSGCQDTAYASVTIRPVPEVFAGNDTVICEGNPVTLNATGNATGYQWQASASLSCTNCTDPVVNLFTDETFVLSGSNTVGCTGYDSISIRVKNPFRLTGLPSTDSLCLGQSLALAVSGSENYLWMPVAGINNPSSGNIIVQPTQTITYKVIGFDSANCYSDSTYITIKVNPAPMVDAGADISLIAGRSIQINTLSSNDVVDWQWTPPANLSCSNCPSPVAMPFDDVTYTVTVTNTSGCSAKDEINIRLTCGGNNLFLPTAFTPNGDNNNEVFYPKGVGIFKIGLFQIFNRQGELIYSAGNFNPGDKSRGWDGSYKGQPAPIGNYIYTIEYFCENKKATVQKGNILLLR